MRFDPRRVLVAGPPFLWLLVFFALPFAIVVKISLSDGVTASPPYKPVFDAGEGLWNGLVALVAGFDLENYTLVFGDELYRASFWTSLRFAGISTLILILIGYPMAHAMTRAPAAWKPVLVALVILPFWTSFLIRVYAWIAILKPEGLLNALLIRLGLVSEPLVILNTDWAVYIGIVYSYLPFMVLPLYAVLDKLDDTLLEAARDLGASPARAFQAVTLPLSLPGVLAGSLLVFIPAMGEFVIPDLLGASDTLTMGQMIWKEMFSNRDWPLASAIAVVLLAVLVIPILVAIRGREAAP